MGIFGKILSGLEVVGGAALEFVPGMQLAGAVLITEGLASSGLIGGSVGKFLKSGVGQTLMGAVALGSTAYSMFGSDILSDADVAEAQAAGAQYNTEQAAVAATKASGAAVTQDLTAGTSGAAGAANGAGDAVPLPQAIAQTSGSPTASLAAPGQPTTDMTLNAGGAPQAQAAATQQAQTAVQPGAAGSQVPPESTGPNPQPVTNVPKPGGGGGGFLNNALNSRAGAAAIQAGGSLVGGIGQGITQKQTMQDQINAMQWADKSSSNPQLQSQFYGASTQPITVPQGYLARAQALRTMLNQGGVAGVQPAGAPATPSGGPVPVLGMNATPRGGVT